LFIELIFVVQGIR
ncbi:unnamed protein product, partial [Rotaria sp. Silwood1]